MISAAADGMGVDSVGRDPAGRRPSRLRAVEAPASVDVAERPVRAVHIAWGAKATAEKNDKLGRSGLRMAFWLCGFEETMRERQRLGETLTAQEQSLLALARKDFVAIRPEVIELALERLQAVVSASAFVPGVEQLGEQAPGPMELFALETLRAFSQRASDLLRGEGPAAALLLFGDGNTVVEPLAVFQLVFTTSVGLVESFERVIAGEAKLLNRLGEMLGSEVERI